MRMTTRSAKYKRTQTRPIRFLAAASCRLSSFQWKLPHAKLLRIVDTLWRIQLVISILSGSLRLPTGRIWLCLKKTPSLVSMFSTLWFCCLPFESLATLRPFFLSCEGVRNKKTSMGGVIHANTQNSCSAYSDLSSYNSSVLRSKFSVYSSTDTISELYWYVWYDTRHTPAFIIVCRGMVSFFKSDVGKLLLILIVIALGFYRSTWYWYVRTHLSVWYFSGERIPTFFPFRSRSRY